MSGNSFFSQISSFFGGSQNQGSYNSRRPKSTFGSGLPSSSRRGPPSALDSNAWSLPYSHAYGQDPNSPTIMNGAASPLSGQYPPTPFVRSTSPYASETPTGAMSTSSVAAFTNQHPAASTSTLVPNGQLGGPTSSVRSSTGVIIPSTAYPPLRHTWNRIRAWCDGHYEEIGDTLNWPASEEALDELEMTIGFALPAAVRESFLCYDGQEVESNQSCQNGLFFGLPMLSVEQVAEEWKFWRAVDEDPETGANPQVKALMASCPHKWIRAEYSCRGWIPLITDHAGNYIGVDLSPYPSGGGAPGQVIVFGRDFDTKVVIWRGEGEGGWGRFLQSFAEELEQGGIWTLEEISSESDEEEDTIGYESYFSGGGGRGGGDRAGEGTASFKLTGEYKGWPVMEAWADRSVRAWESVGLAPGKPLQGHLSQAGDDSMPSLRMVDENGEALDAEGSSRSRRGSSVMHADDEVSGEPVHPLANSFTAADLADTSTSPMLSGQSSGSLDQVAADTSLTHAGSGSGNVTPTTSTRRMGGMLSPPLPDTKAFRKQKQREDGWGSPQLNQPARRVVRAPPAPAQPLDLPTIDDVKAVHASVLANDGKSHSIQFDDSHTGGRTSYGNLGYHDHAGKNAPRKMDSLELGTRSSADGSSATARGGHGSRYGNDSSAEDSAFSGMDDPLRSDSRPAKADRGSTSTTATSPRASGEDSSDILSSGPGGLKGLNLTTSEEVPSLIDANSLPSSPVRKSFGSNGPFKPSPLANESEVASTVA